MGIAVELDEFVRCAEKSGGMRRLLLEHAMLQRKLSEGFCPTMLLRHAIALNRTREPRLYTCELRQVTLFS